MPLPPPQDQRIPLDAAAALTRRYRQSVGPADVKACLFLRQYVDEVLARPGVSGVRVYFARTEAGQNSLVMVGVGPDGNDMTEATILFNHFPCPPVCTDGRSPLNR